MNGKPKIAACYVRVSTPGQEQEQTIESQLDEIKRRAAEDGNHLADEHIYADDGWTSEMLRRPDLDRMRDAAHDGQFDVLYVYDLGRLSRIYAYQEVILEELRDLGAECISLHDINDPSDEGQVVRAMQGVFHQYERVKITERMRRGKMYKAREGKLVNGLLPYGYIRIPKSEGKSASAKVNEQRAEHVRMIRLWFGREDKSYLWIVRKLHELGIRSPRGMEHWSPPAVRQLLKCDSYHTGLVYYNKTENMAPKKPRGNTTYRRRKRTSHKSRPREQWISMMVPKIVADDGLYERIIARIEENKKNARRNRKYPYLLAGKVMCDCGMHRVGTGNHAIGYYYSCGGRIYKYPVGEKCRIPGVKANVIDEAVWSELAKLIENPNLIRKNVELWVEQNGKTEQGRTQEQASVEEKIAKVRDEEQRYARAYGTGDIELPQFRELMQETKRRRVAYQKQLDELRSVEITQPRVILGELPDEVKLVIKSLDHENKQRVVQKIIDNVKILPDNWAEVHIAIPSSSAGIVGLQNAHFDTHFAMRSLHLTLAFTIPKLRKKRRNAEEEAQSCMPSSI